MVDDLYIHIGHPKTGTGSLQQTFRANARLLRDNGVFYDARPHNHHPIAHTARGGEPQKARARQISHRFFRSLRAAREPVAILSTEALIRLSEAEAAAFVRKLSRHARRVTVVMYVRHPVAAANSFAHEGVRIGKPLDEIVARPRVLPLRRLVEQWQKAVDGHGCMIVRPFAPALLHGGDVVDDLLAVMGRPDLASGLTRVRLNEPLSALGITLLDRAHRIGPVPRDATRIFEGIEGPRYVLPEKALEVVRRRAEPELSYLRKRFGMDLPEPNETPTPPPDLDEETLTSVAAILRQAALHAYTLDSSLLGRVMEQPSPFTRRQDAVTHPVAPMLRRLGVTDVLATSKSGGRSRRRRRGLRRLLRWGPRKPVLERESASS